MEVKATTICMYQLNAFTSEQYSHHMYIILCFLLSSIIITEHSEKDKYWLSLEPQSSHIIEMYNQTVVMLPGITIYKWLFMDGNFQLSIS